MRQIDKDSQLVHDLHHLPAHTGEPRIVGLGAPAPKGIGVVVAQLYDAYPHLPQGIECGRNRPRVFFQRVGVLEPKNDAELFLFFCGHNIFGIANELGLFRVEFHERVVPMGVKHDRLYPGAGIDGCVDCI